MSAFFCKFLCSLITYLKSRTSIKFIVWINNIKAYYISNKKFYVASILHAQVYFDKIICKTLIDTKIEINIMIKKTQDWFDLSIQLDPVFWLIFHIGYKWDFVEMYKNVDVSVGKMITKQNIFIVNSADHMLVLEILFIIKAWA